MVLQRKVIQHTTAEKEVAAPKVTEHETAVTCKEEVVRLHIVVS